MNDESLEWEEQTHARYPKESRKERKRLSQKDRSKYKKTDRDKPKKQVGKGIPPDLLKGRVLAINADGIWVDHQATLYLCTLKGALKQQQMRVKNLITVGDFVQFQPGAKDQGSIVLVEERHSVLARAEHLSGHKQQLIAVNIDQVLITVSVVLPSLKPTLIDRYIIAARKGNMEPILVINKIDLLTTAPEKEESLFHEIVPLYRSLGIPVFPVSAETGEGLYELKAAMIDKSSVFSGQSGSGKSSLINALLGSALAVGAIIEKTGKGSHKTSSTHLLPLAEGGFCIDTPGIRSFGLWDLKREEIQHYFSEIAAFAKTCKFSSCSHTNEPDCAVQQAVEAGAISRLRFDSYCDLIVSNKDQSTR
jgi:ribosome biogenesis GTPase